MITAPCSCEELVLLDDRCTGFAGFEDFLVLEDLKMSSIGGVGNPDIMLPNNSDYIILGVIILSIRRPRDLLK
jgi:hypothetical protein